jgi:hypothetical protein
VTEPETAGQRRQRFVAEIAADVKALVEPRRHTEPYKAKLPGTRKQRWYGHVTSQPSLLDALREGGAPAGSDEGESSSGSNFESQPPGAFDCFSRLMAIEAGSAWWVSVGLRQPLRDGAEDNLRALVGLAADPATRDVDLRDLAADVARFHRWASVLAGWERPPRALRASCPLCEKRGSLRVRVLEREGMCLHCGATWDRVTIGVLADHVRAEGERIDDAEPATPNERAG